MRYKMTIEPITFVHIGSGNEVDILNYIITNNKFYRINISNFYEGLKDKYKTQFEEIIDKLSNTNPPNVDYINIRKEFLKFLTKGITALEKNLEKQKRIIQYKSHVDNDVVDKYQTDLSNANSQFIITEAMHRLPDYKPYIPGSSIKGAIRTALLSYIINKLNLQRSDFPLNNPNDKNYKKNPGRSAEAEILNYNNKTIQKDPFRVLQITDTEGFDYDSLSINQTINYTKSGGLNDKIKIFNEYIMPNNISYFELIINERLFEDKINNYYIDAISKKIIMKNNNLNTKDIFNMEIIKKACNEFYFDKLDKDYKNYFNINNKSINIISKEKINEKIDKNKNEFLIRIGRFSQFESMTMDNLRNKNNFKSRMVVRNNDILYPSGWAKITYEYGN